MVHLHDVHLIKCDSFTWDGGNSVNIKYPTIGICGLSCRLCPRKHADGPSACQGCKTQSRMAAGCPFITCALKKEQVEFCWDCQKNAGCMKWNSHREAGKNADSFKCYQGLEKDIAAVQKRGIGPLVKEQDEREAILRLMLAGFNEGRSKSYYCIATTVMAVDELRDALSRAQDRAAGLDMKAKSEMLHSILDETARKKGYLLKLRK